MSYGNRRHIPRAAKEQVISMTTHLRPTQIANITGISRRTIHRTLALCRKIGAVENTPLERGRKRKLDVFDIAFLEGCIERQPDIYVCELQHELEEACGIKVHDSTITRTLRRRGFSRKAVSHIALERDEERRLQYQAYVGGNLRADQLVFVDESACNRNTTKRTMAWAPIGMRARCGEFFVRGTRYSILPAISLDGVLHLDVRQGSWTGTMFHDFIDGLLDNMNPFPQRNSVIVMDNASIHHSLEMRELVEARGMRLLYLPPYSPDFNPIEEAFSAIKAWIHTNRDYVLGELSGDETADPYAMIWSAVFGTITPEKVEGWYKDCGYC